MLPNKHLREPGSWYSAFVLFIKNKERTQKFKETEDSPPIFQKVLEKNLLSA